MSSPEFVKTGNGEAFDRTNVPVMDYKDFRASIIKNVDQGMRVSALPAWRPEGIGLRMMAVLSCPSSGDILIGTCDAPDPWHALTPDCPALHLFEREIAEIWKVKPEGHPWLKRVRFLPGN